MPFSKEDRIRILLALRLSPENESLLETSLTNLEQQSEYLVSHVQELVDKIQEAEQKKHEAATEDAGVLEIGGGDIGGIKFDSHRPCIIQRHSDELKGNLASLLGLSIQFMSFPF